MPRVSVVTGFYNRAPLLRRTIESILAQTFEDFELLVFDDASTDDTAEVLASLSAEFDDPRFRYKIHSVNVGFVRGLRDAISETTGEYIAIQGSGDTSLPARLERQSQLMDARPELGVVGGWYLNVQDDLGTERLRTPDADSLTYEQLMKQNLFSHGEVMIRRSVYDKVGGYRTEFRFAQDIDLWLRVSRTARFATVPEPIYRRHVQFDGVSYVPKKIVEQSCYSVAARRLSTMSAEEVTMSLARMAAHGPTAVVPTSDPVVQRKVVKAVLRLAIFGSPVAAWELADSSVTSPVSRWILKLFARLYGSRFFSPLVPLVRRALGMGSGSAQPEAPKSA